MPQQTINIGTVPNDSTGDPLRDAFDKTNLNFTELYGILPVPLSKLTQSSATSGQVIIWNGSAWVATTLAPSSLSQSGASSGQVITWNGSAWVPATPSSPARYVSFQPVPSNYAVGITFGVFNASFTPYFLDVLNNTYAIFVLDFTPTTCRITYTQQETNTANDCDVGFEIAAAATFASPLTTGYLALGTTFGTRTTTVAIGSLSGGPPYYVRWGYRNPSSIPTLNIVGLSLTFS
jgi:hypothetical protein